MSNTGSTYQLYLLIQRLSKLEKRHFHKYTDRLSSSEETMYLHLFDVLNKMKSFDEGLLLQRLKGNDWEKKLPAQRKYLETVIFKSLADLHTGKTISHQIKDLLEEAHILADKRLHDYALKKLHKARKLSEEHEIWYYLPDAYALERRILKQKYPGKFQEKLMANLSDEKEAIAIMENKRGYVELWHRMFHAQHHARISRDAKDLHMIEEIMEHPLLLDESKATTPIARLYYNAIHGDFYALIGHPERSTEFFYRIMKYRFDTEKHTKDDPYRIIAAISNYLNACCYARKFDDFEKHITQLEEIKVRTRDNRIKIQERSFELRMLKASLTMDEESLDGLISSWNDFCTHEDYNLSKEKIYSINYILALSKFAFGKYEDALSYLDVFLQQPESGFREDLQVYARILYLLIQYERGESYHLEYTLQSTYRFLYKRKILFRLEAAIIKYLRKLVFASGQTQQSEVLVQLKGELTDILDNPLERNALLFLDYLAWVESKIQGTSFAEAYLKCNGLN